jgi:hypothetical protein
LLPNQKRITGAQFNSICRRCQRFRNRSARVNFCEAAIRPQLANRAEKIRCTNHGHRENPGYVVKFTNPTGYKTVNALKALIKYSCFPVISPRTLNGKLSVQISHQTPPGARKQSAG